MNAETSKEPRVTRGDSTFSFLNYIKWVFSQRTVVAAGSSLACAFLVSLVGNSHASPKGGMLDVHQRQLYTSAPNI